MGLFLKEEERGIPVMSIPRELVDELAGNVVSMVVQSHFRPNAKMPVIIAGDDEAKVGVISHYCHPYEMYNDNLSGTVANILVAKQARAFHLFVPEYWGGSFAYMLDRGGKLAQESFVNLDMVGGEPERDGLHLDTGKSASLHYDAARGLHISIA